MNPFETSIDYWNRKVRKFTMVDVKVAQLWAMVCILIIAKLFPPIMQLSVWWFVAVGIPCALRLIYTLWIKADEPCPHGT